MTTVNIVETETTLLGEMADAVVDKNIQPAVGMMLMDEDSLTWEVTAMLHDSKRATGEEFTKLWTFQCKPINTDKPIHTGPFKLIH